MSQSKYPFIAENIIDEKIAQMATDNDPLLFGTPQEVFQQKLTDVQKNYFVIHIFPYRMRALGYKGETNGRGVKERCGEFLTKKIQPFKTKKENNEQLTEKDREECRKIQIAYNSLLQNMTSHYRLKFKLQFPILDNWIHNHKVRSERVEANSNALYHFKYNKQYYGKTHPDAKSRISVEEHIKADPEFLQKKQNKYLEHQKQYYRDNRQAIRAYYKQYYLNKKGDYKQYYLNKKRKNQLLITSKANNEAHNIPWQEDKISQEEHNNNTVRLDNDNNSFYNAFDNNNNEAHNIPWQEDKISQEEHNNNTVPQLNNYNSLLYNNDDKEPWYEDKKHWHFLSPDSPQNSEDPDDLFNLDSNNKEKSMGK